MKEEKVSEEIVSEKMLLAVLNETLEEMQKANKSLKEIGHKVEHLAGKIGQLETRVGAFEQKEIRIEPPDLEPLKGKIDEFPVAMAGKLMELDDNVNKGLVLLRTTVREETAAGLAKIAAAVEAQPKPIVRRITFFPENDREGNYKTLIRWMIGGIVGLLLIGSAYVLANEWIGRTRQWQTTAAGLEMKLAVDTPAVARPVPVSGKKPSKHARQR